MVNLETSPYCAVADHGSKSMTFVLLTGSVLNGLDLPLDWSGYPKFNIDPVIGFDWLNLNWIWSLNYN